MAPKTNTHELAKKGIRSRIVRVQTRSVLWWGFGVICGVKILIMYCGELFGRIVKAGEKLDKLGTRVTRGGGQGGLGRVFP